MFIGGPSPEFVSVLASGPGPAKKDICVAVKDIGGVCSSVIAGDDSVSSISVAMGDSVSSITITVGIDSVGEVGVGPGGGVGGMDVGGVGSGGDIGSVDVSTAGGGVTGGGVGGGGVGDGGVDTGSIDVGDSGATMAKSPGVGVGLAAGGVVALGTRPRRSNSSEPAVRE